MITEDYVSFELAKLLKDKGFDEPCDNYYDQSSDEPQQLTLDEMYYSYDEFLKAPTQQMAMKWLREVYNIFIEISTSIDLNGKYHFNYSILDKECKYVRRGYTDFDWNYNQACEAAIKYCLENFIEM